MNNMKFTNDEALYFAKVEKTEEWVHLFLNTVGNNSALSQGLKLEKRYWTGPLLISLNKLKRVCGPEPEMPYYNEPVGWESRIGKLQQLIKEGWDMPPLIVQHEGNELIVNDGNHRMEALYREGFEKCWVIIWNTHFQDDIKDFI